MLDGDDMDSAMDFLIKEGIQSYEQKPDGTSSAASDYVHVDDVLMIPDAKKHPVTLDQDEESIVWKGGFKSNVPRGAQVIYSDQGHGLDDIYDSNCQQEEAISPGNQRIDWWATTWPNVAGSKNDEGMYNSSSNSSVHTDSNTQEATGTLTWSDMEQYKSIRQKVYWQGGTHVDIDYSSTGSTQSLTLEKENTSLWSTASGLNNFDEGCKSLVQLGLPLSQESFKVFNPKALEVSSLEAERSVSRSDDEPSKGYVSDDDSKISSGQSVNVKSVWKDSLVQENLLESSRYNINTEDLDKFVNEAKSCKENVRKDMEDIYLLRQKAEQEELAAQHAKTEAASSGLEIFLKVEDMRQKMSRERAEYEMRAAEVYGEKSVLSMEARELKSRLLETKAEQAKALSLLDSIRCSLSARLEKASQEKQYAIDETKMKVKKAEKLLASEQASAQKLAEKFKVLETEAETCKKLREFLIERGNIVDSLQGEMAVLCEDVLTFKEQVDEGIPLSAASRSLSWSRMSHLTEQFSLTSSPGDAKDCRSSRCTALDSSICLNSISSTSILTLSSATSELPKSVQPIECALHSQYFSPGNSMVDTTDQGSNKKVIKEMTMDGQEAAEEIVESCDTTVRQVCNDGKQGQQQQEENLHSASKPC